MSPQGSTGFSPFEVVFGHPARLPFEQALIIPLQNPSLQSEYARNLRTNLSNIQREAKEYFDNA